MSEPRHIVLLRRQFADRPERLAEVLRREGVDDQPAKLSPNFGFPQRLSGWYLVIILGITIFVILG